MWFDINVSSSAIDAKAIEDANGIIMKLAK